MSKPGGGSLRSEAKFRESLGRFNSSNLNVAGLVRAAALTSDFKSLSFAPLSAMKEARKGIVADIDKLDERIKQRGGPNTYDGSKLFMQKVGSQQQLKTLDRAIELAK